MSVTTNCLFVRSCTVKAVFEDYEWGL